MSGVSGPPIITDGTVGSITIGSFGTAVGGATISTAYWLVVLGVFIGIVGILWMLYSTFVRKAPGEWKV